MILIYFLIVILLLLNILNGYLNETFCVLIITLKGNVTLNKPRLLDDALSSRILSDNNKIFLRVKKQTTTTTSF